MISLIKKAFNKANKNRHICVLFSQNTAITMPRCKLFQNSWGDALKPRTLSEGPCPWLHILLEDAGLLRLEEGLLLSQLSFALLLEVADFKSNVVLDNILRDGGVTIPGQRAAIIARVHHHCNRTWNPLDIYGKPRGDPTKDGL